MAVTNTFWRRPSVIRVFGCLTLILIVACILLTSCSVSDGGRTLVVLSDPFARRVTGDMCIDSPVEAYIGGMHCQQKLSVTAEAANTSLKVIRGGCAMHYAILEEKPGVFEEFLAKGGNLSRCSGYPSAIYGAVTHICRSKPALAHKFFESIQRHGSFKNYPQVLMWHATSAKCVEGVQIALSNGSGVSRPEGKNWDRGSIGPQSVHSPLEQTVLHGWTSNITGMIEITRILVDAGASPLATDADGATILARAEREHGTFSHWKALKAALLSPRRESDNSGAGAPR